MAELEIKPTPKMRLRVTALVCSGIAVLGLQVYLLSGGGANLFARRTTLTTYLPDGSGITTDSEVRLSGIRIGHVQKVELSGSLEPGRTVRVEMRVLSRYLRNIPADSQTDINADTLVAAKFIDIAEGKSPLPLPENSLLPSKLVVEATDRAAVLASVQQDLTQVDSILQQMASPDTKIGKFVKGEVEYDRLVSAIGGAEKGLETFINPRSDLGKAVYSPDMYNRMLASLANADKMLVSIQSGQGAAGHLFASDEQYNQVITQLKDLRASLAGANASSLLASDAGYTRITRLLAATDAMMASLNAGEGQTGRLLANPQLYESLNGSLRSMQAFLKDLRENPQKYLRYKLF